MMRGDGCAFAGMLILSTLLGCERSERDVAPPVAERCPSASPSEPGLSLRHARAAHAHEARRHERRLFEALRPGSTLRLLDSRLQEVMAEPRPCVAELQAAGRIVFEYEFDFASGLGSAAAAERSSGPFRRVQDGDGQGPDTTGCTSCHWRGGAAGAGAWADNSLLLGDGDRVPSADARNPPALAGVAVVQRLAEEMTAELSLQRERALRRYANRGDQADDDADDGEMVEVALSSKGVSFGRLLVDPEGQVDTSLVEGVDADLVVRPFGWKGNFATLDEFIRESFHSHFGVQADALIAARNRVASPTLGDGPVEDPDGDGVERELSDALLLSVITYLAGLPLPEVRPPAPTFEIDSAAEPLPAPTSRRFATLWAEGQQQFQQLGCASCHRPQMVLDDPLLHLSIGDHTVELDLSGGPAGVGLTYDAELQGYPVWLFSDLKRHDLGKKNRSQHEHRGVARQDYQTRRLWGLADSAPYLHDGRAPDVDSAIAGHDGEAAAVAERYAGLPDEQQAALRMYLLSLGRPWTLSVP